MYIVVNKDSGEHIKNTGTNTNSDEKGIYNNLKSTINKNTEEIIFLDDKSIFVEILNILIDSNKRFKVELEDNKVFGFRLLK